MDDIDLEDLNIEELDNDLLFDLSKELYTLRDTANNTVTKLKEAIDELDTAKTNISSSYKIDEVGYNENEISKVIMNLDSLITKMNACIVVIDEKLSKINIQDDMEVNNDNN